MGHARPPVGLINRDQDAGAASCEKYVLQPPPPPPSAILAVAVTKFFRKAEKEGKNTLFYRDTGKNIRGDSFHPGGKRYWR